MTQSDLSTFSASGEADDGAASDAGDAAAVVAGNGGGRISEVVDVDDAKFPESTGTVELMVTQVDYTIEGSGREEHPIIHVFGRRADGTHEHVRVLGFEPYFYVPTDSLDTPPQEEYDVVVDSRETDPDGEGFESIRGEQLTKIIGRTPRDVGEVRDEFDHYEADILFPNRFLIDKGINSGIKVSERRLGSDDDTDGPATIQVPHTEAVPADVDSDLRVNIFDIEVDDRRGFPEDGEEPIVCLTSYDSFDEQYIAWLYEAPDGDGEIPDELPDYDPYQDDIAVDVRAFDSEAAMLDAFIDYIDDTDPDLVSGWNFEDFDAPYFLDRLEVVDKRTDRDLSVDRLSRIDEVWRSGWGGPDIKGRVVFDLLYGYKRTQFTELDSYRLDAVGELELGVGKERYAGDIGDLWEDDPTQLLEYNLRDVELCVEIDRKQSVIAFWDEVRRFVGCLLEDAPTPGDAVDVYVLHNAYGRFALPTKGQQESEEFEGGAVFEPVTGVRENVTVLDLKSLYPMCMVTINASPETKVDPEAYDGETYRAPNGTHFRAEPDGMMREMVDELLTEREEKKTKRDQHEPGTDEYVLFNRQQAATKVIMNSLYGVSGWDRFRLYDKENAAAVTATGREVLSFTEDVAGEINYQIAYGDSVTGDRPVVVRDSDGLVRILPIEDLFERAKIRPEAEVLITADGGAASTVGLGKERGTLDGWDALSVNDAGDAEWQPIEEVVRHETDDPVVRLRHKFGESTTTRDHSYVVEDGDAFTEAPPDDVSEPLRVPGLPNVERVETVDVYEMLRGYEREYVDGRGGGDDRTKIKRVHADDEWVWFGHEHARDQSKTVRVKRQIDLDGEDGRALVRLLAAYVTEGSASTVETTDSRFGASIAESRREWLDGLKRDYQRLFDGVATSLVTSDVRDDRTVEYETNAGGESVTYDDCTIQLQMMNELSAVFFRELAGQTSRGKRIPSFVFHLSDELQTLFLDTLVEGDGSREFPRYSEAYAEQNVDFETTSRELAAGLSMLLTQRGRKHSLKYRDAKESYTVRTCGYYCEGRAPELTEFDHHDYVYDLSVAENENFVDAVGGVVLHNTDSVMLELGSSVTKSEAIDLSFDIEAHINDRYDDFARERLGAEEHRFQIEFEKLYRRFFQAGKKKRYAGHIVWKEGNDVDDIDITGFEYKRSDIAQVTKRVQREVIEMIVRGEDLDEVKDFLHQEITTFESGERSLAEVGIPGGIGKRLDAYDTDTAQVRGARYANELLGTNFGRGSKPKRVYLRKVHPDFFRHLEDEEGLDPASDPVYAAFKRDPDVICFEYDDQVPDEFEVDWERMLEKTLQGPIARVIEALGMSWDEVRSGQTQTGLGQFG